MSVSSSRNQYTGDTKLRGPTRSRLLEAYVQLKKADAKKNTPERLPPSAADRAWVRR
jgi:hypothetical protein